MPRLRIKYLAPLCDISGRWAEDVDVPADADLRSLVDERSAIYGPQYRSLFYDKNGDFKPMFIVLRNDEALTDFDSPLVDGDRITFIPPVAGG